MVIAGKESPVATWPIQSPGHALNPWRAWAHRRLTTVFEAAPEILFDDRSRIVFFSDCHRGDNSSTDAFAKNKTLFLAALSHYFQRGFSYVEVGDGDELWKNRRFGDILQAHRQVFDLLHRFQRQNRLHVVFGNHDIHGHPTDRMEKAGVVAQEGLILRHRRTGQRIFVVHGHQADFKSDGMYLVSRFAVRHVWRRLQALGFKLGAFGRNVAAKRSPGRWHNLKIKIRQLVSLDPIQAQSKTERQIISWVQARRQTVICGHTHRPRSAAYGAPPYFNAGSCVMPGAITGLEIHHGEIALVKWSWCPTAQNGKSAHAKRELLGPALKLCWLG